MSGLSTGVLLSALLLAGPGASGCGEEVARTTGSIHLEAPWSGTWPAEGLVVVALFKVSPWDAAFEPGPPAAYRVIYEPDGPRLAADIAEPGVPFDTYQSLVLAWQDPDPPEQSAHMLPMAVAGTDLAHLEAAAPIELSAEAPDASVDLPAVVLDATADEMRSRYAPVGTSVGG
ncbi:MAG TPA: hypothetical protein P5076_09875 [Myxococcota bacterium]|nr:hypothetical protein [Myxococcota bacterium]